MCTDNAFFNQVFSCTVNILRDPNESLNYWAAFLHAVALSEDMGGYWTEQEVYHRLVQAIKH